MGKDRVGCHCWFAQQCSQQVLVCGGLLSHPCKRRISLDRPAKADPLGGGDRLHLLDKPESGTPATLCVSIPDCRKGCQSTGFGRGCRASSAPAGGAVAWAKSLRRGIITGKVSPPCACGKVCLTVDVNQLLKKTSADLKAPSLPGRYGRCRPARPTRLPQVRHPHQRLDRTRRVKEWLGRFWCDSPSESRTTTYLPPPAPPGYGPDTGALRLRRIPPRTLSPDKSF